VAPLQRISGDVFAWVGLDEVWTSVAGTLPFAFKQLGITIHFGLINDPVKPQAFRAEWAGVADWGGGSGLGFQSPGAGHPHWQFDALESLRAVEAAAAFEPEPSELVEAFDADVAIPDLLLDAITIERMHFASVAPWWRSTPTDTPVHVHAPADEQALTRWTAGCLEYLKQELGRCHIL
jgi:hypothetical protein